jgi:uncharacterized protein
MKRNLFWANLYSADLNRTTQFFEALGFKNNNTDKTPGIASFSFGDPGFIINFFGAERFGENIKSPITDTSLSNEILFSISAGSREEVDQWSQKVERSGGAVFLAPHDYMGGYNCGFADPDGHKFNVFYSPSM